MKIRNSFAILGTAVFAMSFMVTGCNFNRKAKGSTFTVEFESNGGSAVASQTVSYGEKATKPQNPTKSGYTFANWYEDAVLVTPFNFNTPITSDWKLYAKWTPGGSTTSQDTSSGGSSSTTTSQSQQNGHGPEGSTLADWYLCGEGSLWEGDGWQVANGKQLYTNPASETDKGCILSLAVQAGDLFKVTDGNTWFGYEKVQTGGEGNMGTVNFEGANDGYNGQNFRCKVSGTYDMYINKDGNFWIQASN